MSIVEQVRAAAIGIPTGRVASYGDIGAMIGAGPRQVGRAMTFLDDDVPWWRVVYANGTPASCHGGGHTACCTMNARRWLVRG